MLRPIQNNLNKQLKKAFINRNIVEVESLLTMKANPDILIREYPLISHAVDKKWVKMVEVLINYGADVHWKDSYGNNLLHVAIHKGSLKMTRLLVNSGIDLEDGDDEYNTPLDIACQRRQMRIIKYLLPLYGY